MYRPLLLTDKKKTLVFVILFNYFFLAAIKSLCINLIYSCTRCPFHSPINKAKLRSSLINISMLLIVYGLENVIHSPVISFRRCE